MSDDGREQFEQIRRRHAKRHGYEYRPLSSSFSDDETPRSTDPVVRAERRARIAEQQRNSTELVQYVEELHQIENGGFSRFFLFPWKLFKGLLWLLFIMPGGLITWKQYYFPERGKVYATGRRLNNPIVKVIFSIMVWIPILVVIGLIYLVYENKPLAHDLWQAFKGRVIQQ